MLPIKESIGDKIPYIGIYMKITVHEQDETKDVWFNSNRTDIEKQILNDSGFFMAPVSILYLNEFSMATKLLLFCIYSQTEYNKDTTIEETLKKIGIEGPKEIEEAFKPLLELELITIKPYLGHFLCQPFNIIEIYKEK